MQKNGIDVEICQIRIQRIRYTQCAHESNLEGTDLIVTTSRIKRDYGIPYVNGMAFISGIGEEATEAKMLEVLKK